MSKVIVACAQQQMRLFDSSDSYRREISRFLNMARAKGAQLMVFPPLTGVMAASPRVQGFSINLLKQAAEQQRGRNTFWSRTRGAVAEGTASLLGASFRKAFIQTLKGDTSGLVADYDGMFADMARTYEMAIVAGTAYLPDESGVIRHRATVFAADGSVLGRHDRLFLSAEDDTIAEPGDAWNVIDTPAGKVGILIGEEALYPEAGRILSHLGAELLITLDAVGDESLAAHVRHATIARAQDNRCHALTCFLVGRNYMAAEVGSAPQFVGKSGIYAPLEMTPRYSGVLVEMGAADVEGLLTAELDRPKLQWLWQHGSSSVRRMPVSLFERYLPAVYSSAPPVEEPAEETTEPAESKIDGERATPEEALPGGAEIAEQVPTALEALTDGAKTVETLPDQPESLDVPGRIDLVDGEGEGI